jgi:hypothetical protein
MPLSGAERTCSGGMEMSANDPKRKSSVDCEGDSLCKHHSRTDTDATIQVHDVLVVHADAARGHEAADRGRIVRAVDGEFAVDKH